MIVEISGAEKAWGEREWRGGSHENWRGVNGGFLFLISNGFWALGFAIVREMLVYVMCLNFEVGVVLVGNKCTESPF